MNKEFAEKIIDYVVTATKPRWITWTSVDYSNLDEVFIPRGYEQGGFAATVFYDLLEEKKISPIKELGSILENFSGENKYIRQVAGSLGGTFYRDLNRGVFSERGKAFYECVEAFLNNPRGKAGFMFWMKLWQMLICTRNLKLNHQSSFKRYLKNKYCRYKNLIDIEDTDFFNILSDDWQQFMEKAYPWDELYGIGDNVFDFLIRDVKEFKFAKDSFKLDSANIRFFEVTGISKLVDISNKYKIVQFLKRLKLEHNYQVREINTGIYTYCSDTERAFSGFCRNREKCKECQVNRWCERNL